VVDEDDAITAPTTVRPIAKLDSVHLCNRTLSICWVEFVSYRRRIIDEALDDLLPELAVIALEGASGSITGDWSSGQDRLKLSGSRQGQCYLDQLTYGPEDFYSVQLEAGELLSVTMNKCTERVFEHMPAS